MPWQHSGVGSEKAPLRLLHLPRALSLLLLRRGGHGGSLVRQRQAPARGGAGELRAVLAEVD